jgi:ABC-type bacteriocin/lantibiotic exporter with double-glycine peptidase domain
MRAHLGPGLYALGLTLLPGCFFTIAQPKLPIASRLSPGAVRLGIPFVPQQKPYLCGLAAVSMLSQYYRLPLTGDRLAALSRLAKQRQGLSGADLKSALQEAGFFVAVFPGGLDHGDTGLYTDLDQKRPVLVMLDAGAPHYCVLAGYDEVRGTVDLVDPDGGERLMGRPEFVKAWDAAERFSLLALPASLLKTDGGPAPKGAGPGL